MPDDRIPKQLLYGELTEGKRKVGGQKKRFKDNVKIYLREFSIDIESWETLATDRPSWRCAISSGARRAEKQHAQRAEQKRQMRKARAASTNSTASTHFCPNCGRGFLARIGLVSHLRAQKCS